MGVPSDHVHPAGAPPAAPGGYRKGSLLASWLSSTDHKIIGHLYLITSFGFFLIAGLMAMIMRIQLFGPDDHQADPRPKRVSGDQARTTRSAGQVPQEAIHARRDVGVTYGRFEHHGRGWAIRNLLIGSMR